jgi:hypothetical protein
VNVQYDLAQRFFSYGRAEGELLALLNKPRLIH